MLCFMLLVSLLHATSSTVYYVIPDDHCTISNNTYTLQHYLNNINKYFTSHTQLYFLPGKHYLNTNLIIQHVSALSLIGNRTNDVINSVIKCTSPAGIAVVNSSNIIIGNIMMEECGSDFNDSESVNILLSQFSNQCRLSLLTLNCRTLKCYYFHSTWQYNSSGIRLINGLGYMALTNVISTYLSVWNIRNTPINKVLVVHINNFRAHNAINYTYAIDILQDDSNVGITVILLNTNFSNKLAICIRHINSYGNTRVKVFNCNFSANDKYKNDNVLRGKRTVGFGYGCNESINYADVNFDSMIYSYFMIYSKYSGNNAIQFINCTFHGINNLHTKKLLEFYEGYIINDFKYLKIFLINCRFLDNNNVELLSIVSYGSSWFPYVSVVIKNCAVLFNKIDQLVFAITADKVALYIENIIIKSNIFHLHIGNIIGAKYSYVQFSGYNEISFNVAFMVILCPAIYLQENTVLDISQNTFSAFIHIDQSVKDEIRKCAIQYISDRGNLDNEFQQGQKLNYSIVFSNNSIRDTEVLCDDKVLCDGLMHCTWDESSVFQSSIPLQVNQRFITMKNFKFKESKRPVCLCDRYGTQYCEKGEIGPFYPGQTISPKFSTNNTFFARIEIRRGYSSFICDNDQLKLIELKSNECKALKYTIKHNKKWCELILTVSTFESFFSSDEFVLQKYSDLSHDETVLQKYTVLLQPCPAGFSLHPQGYCRCDPILSSHIPSLTTCDIDHQTIPRPANTWISAHTVNNSHYYYVSLHCPFDYCLPHSSQLNLSTPDSQCQFNRSGVMCGQCQRGLSTVFGSSQCKNCSDIYLIIIIPIAIAGLIIVLMLFILNITVTNGDINSFLLYINIIIINSPIFFPTGGSVMYAFSSLANLDLGIETCFYHGMNDYAKMWLQLLFPMYLIFMAAVLIITSRYFTTIQRLTARRALPVLATLFLLSYTKVLITVSNVLFSFTSITHLPYNHTTLVWSVDTSVPLFGLKFTVLFIACLILFLILIPFNVVLIFTKKLSYFKVVTYFKPLLDAYQGPYKIKFHFWAGLQLLVRVIFFGLSALNRNINLMISGVLLGVIIWLHEKFSPYKSNINNITEAIALINLQMIVVVSLYTTSNAVAVNISVSLAMLLLFCIVLIHLKRLLHITTFKMTHFSWNSFTKLLNKIRQNVNKGQSNNTLELINPVPEVTYDYEAFQEPLVEYDK